MSEEVRITKFDESYIQIHATRAVLMELSDRFSFTVPNANFLTSVKNRYWDGKIRLLDLRSGKLYFGLHTHVAEFCKTNGYECIYEDPIDVEIPFSVNEFRSMIASLKLSVMNDEGVRVDITPHDYQEQAVIHAIQAGRTLLHSPTASGKSLMIYLLMRYYLAITKGKVLIIVPTTNLVQQMYDDFTDYAANISWDVQANCHMIYDGGEKQTDKRVVISTWQALAVKEPCPKELREIWTKAQIKMWYQKAPYILDESYFAQFNTVFGDECHLFASEDNQGGGELIEIMSKLCNAKYRIGTTGTLRDSKVHHLILEGIFGGVYQTTTTKEMMDRKKAAQLFIKVLELQYPQEERKAMRKKTYQEEMEFLIGHTSRSRFIRNLALSLRGNTLVLFERVEKHGKILHKMLEEKIADGRKLFFVHGGTDAEDRNLVRKITEGEVDAIIVASYGTFSTGVNIRNIDNLIFASPTKAKVRVLQSIGRGLRLSARKTTVTLFDIADDLSCWNKAGTEVRDNYSLQHLTERVNYYNTEQFDYKMYKIQLEANESCSKPRSILSEM
jgi:superfamily II DNA or RNA helicase